jgi:hypothetical protein
LSPVFATARRDECASVAVLPESGLAFRIQAAGLPLQQDIRIDEPAVTAHGRCHGSSRCARQ